MNMERNEKGGSITALFIYMINILRLYKFLYILDLRS